MRNNSTDMAADDGRRDLLKKVAVGAAAVWVTPAITSISASAQASGGGSNPGSGGTSLSFRCLGGGYIEYVLSVPPEYQNVGLFLGVDILTANYDYDQCPDAGMFQAIDSPEETWGFIGFGLSGSGNAWIHNGDCVPITYASGTFSCASRSESRSTAAANPYVSVLHRDGSVTTGT